MRNTIRVVVVLALSWLIQPQRTADAQVPPPCCTSVVALKFTLAGIGNGPACPNCAAVMNGPWALSAFPCPYGNPCAWRLTRGMVGPQRTMHAELRWGEQPSVYNLLFRPSVPDGNGNPTVGAVEAIYTCPAFDCKAGGTFTLTKVGSWPLGMSLCTNYPATIGVAP